MKPRVSRQAVLVTGPDDARLDVDASGLGDDNDSEVRHRSSEGEAKDLLGPAQAGRNSQRRGVARIPVAADARRSSSGVAAVETWADECRMAVLREDRHRHAKPEWDSPGHGSPREDDEAGRVALPGADRHDDVE